MEKNTGKTIEGEEFQRAKEYASMLVEKLEPHAKQVLLALSNNQQELVAKGETDTIIAAVPMITLEMHVRSLLLVMLKQNAVPTAKIMLAQIQQYASEQGWQTE